jgi:hypothetical protein
MMRPSESGQGWVISFLISVVLDFGTLELKFVGERVEVVRFIWMTPGHSFISTPFLPTLRSFVSNSELVIQTTPFLKGLISQTKHAQLVCSFHFLS